MPLTEKGKEILANMTKQYGSREKAEQVFYASKNKGTITGVDAADAQVWSPSYRRGHLDEEERRIQPGDIEEGTRTYGPQWGEECRDEAVSEAQRRAMGAAMSGHSQLGIPKSVGKEFIEKDPGGKLPERTGDQDEAPFSSPKPSQPPPSQISGLAGARDQAAYKPAGPENLSLEAINKKNREYWAPEWQRRK